jgi:hypothetical protein
MAATVTRRYADLLLGGELEVFVRSRRAENRAWRLISRDLWESTGGKLDITYETLRSWFPDDASTEGASTVGAAR